jgi:Flp pilus assembly protein TadG
VFLKLRQRLRGGRREGGAATVEFALCLIPLLLIVAGVVDYGESWYIQSALATASREGARYATRYQTDAQTGQRLTPDNLTPSIQDYVLNTDQQNGGTGGYGLRTILPSDANPTVPTPGGAGYTTGTTGAAVSVTVTAEKHWLFMNHLIPGLKNPQPLKAVTTMACE